MKSEGSAKKPSLVVLSGAGISAESGLRTFRDMGGLWENYSIEDVCTPEAWLRNPELVLSFYNQRRNSLLNAQPNAAHLALASLETYFQVHIVTQNVDDLHERAGSSSVLHLHGELTKSRSTKNPSLVYDIQGEGLRLGDLCEEGSQLRPHIVWFREPVPLMDQAIEIVSEADIFLVVGTSLAVYPAASLIFYVGRDVPKYIVDPVLPEVPDGVSSVECIQKKASVGVPELAEYLIGQYGLS